MKNKTLVYIIIAIVIILGVGVGIYLTRGDKFSDTPSRKTNYR